MKCSYQTILEYKSEIYKYLQSKGVSDFTKYEVYITDEDSIGFNKWEYSILKNQLMLKHYLFQ